MLEYGPRVEKRPLIFLSAPFLKFVHFRPNRTAEFDHIAHTFLVSLERACNSQGWTAFLAHRLEDFGNSVLGSEVFTPRDYQAMQRSDCVIAWLDDSYGVHIELGWASAMQKPIVMLVHPDRDRTTPLVDGLGQLTKCRIYKADVTEDAIEDLVNNLVSSAALFVAQAFARRRVPDVSDPSPS